MKPLIVLLLTFGISLLIIKFTGTQWNYIQAGNIAMCCMLLFTAIAHFTFTKGMVLMMPSAIPFKIQLVYITGILEIVFGIGLLLNQTRYPSAILLIAFFLILLPANIMAAKRHVNIEKGDFSGSGLSYLYFRIPLQLFLIAWVCFFSL